ncbi:nucleotidyltransferase family protein [Ruminococcaceae bacterium OttesenSCG-928-A11]|nr:nucleotidyltransferase family protein [Ruminococcaceae bacterium OttesenSCG-928-A11]
MDQAIGWEHTQPFVEAPPPPKGLAQHPPCAGIVTEYNPFHKGHEWMIQRLREGGMHTVVCVMSGPFVQRAEPAILQTHVRARAALAGGADLVLRLPVPWATASAEGFARGAVGLLSALGCVDVLAFGAECRDVAKLEALAGILLDPAFVPLLKLELAKGASFAAARAAATERLMPGAAAILETPNNILAVEYIKALRGAVPDALRGRMDAEVRWRVVNGLYGNSAEMERLFPLPEPLALPRVGAAHDGVPAGGYASASWLRGAYAAQGLEAWTPYVPEGCMKLYREADAQGAVWDYGRYEIALLSRLKMLGPADFAGHPGAGEGLENRLADAAQKATSLEQMYEMAKTKRFAHSRVRRLALGTALGLPKTPEVLPPFAQVLAANGRGLALLKRIKQNAMVPVSTSLAKLEKTGGEGSLAQAVVRAEAHAEDLHAMWLKKPQPGGGAFTRPAAMLVPGQR